VLLLDDHGHHSLAVATCLAQIPGIELHVLSNIRWPAVRLSRFVTSFYTCPDTNNEAAQLDEIRRVSRAVRADVLLPVSESGARLLTRDRAAFNGQTHLPPLPPPELYETVVNKNSLAHCLDQHGIRSAPTFLFTSIAAAERDLKHLPFPVLLKPIFGGTGLGICRFDKPTPLLEALRSRPLASESYILQSYVPGRDVDCSVLCRDGRILAHTLQMSARPRRNPFAADDALAFVSHTAAFAAVEKAMAALRWSGVAHLDMREDERDGQFHIVDFSARFWMTLLGSLAVGVNFPHLACLAALKIEFPPPTFEPANYFTAQAALKELASGRLRGYKSGLPYALNDPGPRALNLIKRFARRVW
jgi:D-aspartate ligase